MANRFLYIDDSSTRDSIAAGLSSSGALEVISEEPLTWNDRISVISQKIKDINGIILDWRLTEESNRTGDREVKYSAEALAQQLRHMSSIRELKGMPIVLCSANEGFKDYYKRDSTGHDLFDEVFEKNDFASKHDTVVKELNCLAEAYKALQTGTQTPPKDLLAATPDVEVDERILSKLATLHENMAPHELIRFLLREVIKKPGVLIDEDILAARLGVDKDKSDDWGILLDNFVNPTSKYNGLLSTAWNRWWAGEIVQWWQAAVNPTHPQFTTAKQRVKLLKERMGLNGLVAAEKLKFCTKSDFWTVCVATKKPISTADGFRVFVNNEQSWHDEQVISLQAILEKNIPDGYKLNPLEKERLNDFRKMIKTNG